MTSHPAPPSHLTSQLASLLAREVDLDALLGVACERVAEALGAERATIWLVDAARGELVSRVATLPELPSLRIPRAQGLAGWVARTGEVVRIAEASADPRFDASVDKATGFTTRSILAAPIREEAGGPVRGVLQVLNRRTDRGTAGVFEEEDEQELAALAAQIARAFALTTLRPADAAEPGVTLRGPFNRIVGTSPELRAVYERVTLAAQTDATVLLRGETGAGKGLFARAIHVNSRRQAGPFVVVDGTTLPAALVESELFGHERGAFTGADRRVPGKVEKAQGGTLFLDELGELSLEVQAKLLRFLQDRAFERVGGRETLAADVRIVCATHRDLERLVEEGRFREDLYYRIRVVEIEIPPLRARGPAEIASLARHFADMYGKRYDRDVPPLGEDLLAVLVAHAWPGNVRELEHWIESAVVLAGGGPLRPEHLPSPRLTPRGRAEAKVAGGLLAAGDAGSGESSTRGAPEGTASVTLPLGLTLDEATRRYVAATVDAAAGNKTEAARRLQVGRNTVGRLLSGAADEPRD